MKVVDPGAFARMIELISLEKELLILAPNYPVVVKTELSEKLTRFLFASSLDAKD